MAHLMQILLHSTLVSINLFTATGHAYFWEP